MATQYTPRVALITGAARGVGRDIARRLAKDGLDIGVHDIAEFSENIDVVVKEVEALGRRAIPLVGDVSLEDDVRDMVATTVAQLGSLDVMVANACIAMRGYVVDISVESWDRTMAVNLRGVMLCYQYAAVQMIKQGRGGRIIGASSILGKQGVKLFGAYVASMFGVRGLTQTAAQELAEYNITVNTYSADIQFTPTIDIPAEDKTSRGLQEGSIAHLLGNLDTPRAGPEAISSIVSYLVKPEAHFITGQSISVSGAAVMD